MTLTPSPLRVDHLHVSYPRARRNALRDVSFSVQPGRTLAVVGPSGAGKSTLLRTIAGLIHAQQGTIAVGDRDVAALPPQARAIALVFQTDALFTRMSVRSNLRFALREGRTGEERVTALADALDIAEHLERMPSSLSGGERQRVAIARALLSDPCVLLLDEPLAHLDPELRTRVRNELIGVRERFNGPIVYVTHDHAEALSIADELLVLIDGAVEDAGDPQRVYDAPRTARVAAFLGERAMNVLDAAPGDVVMGIRPEHVRVDPEGTLRGFVERREPTGADSYLYVRTELGVVCVRVAPSFECRIRDEVALAFDERYVRRFDRASGLAR
ncbi:MAG TPA: ABC transporter ATP-binding protein [Candidatus Baltobacteraceae bacterium]|nr:ABC transporter ATP-binding protein [Candidatus Baltobacteraceae bacterium]